MTVDDPDAEKTRIRLRVRSARRARTDSEVALARSALGDRLSEAVRTLGARRIACYFSLGHEPDPGGFVDWGLENGLDLIFPSSRADGRLDWIELREDTTLTIGPFGIREPVGPRLPPEALARADLVVAPACAVDLRGVRLGWGRGYYDRTLAALPHVPPLYAVVYDDEVLDRVPREAHDVPVAGAITPNRTLDFDSP